MRNFTLTGALIAALLFSGSSIALSFTVELDQATLQQGLATAFPVQRDETFVSVRLAQPQVILQEGSDRIGLKTLITVSLPGSNPFSGDTTVDGKLRYSAKDNALYLDQARVRDLTIAGMPEMARQETLRIASLLLRSFLDKQPLYVFKDDQSSALINKRITRVEVHNGKLLVEVSAD